MMNHYSTFTAAFEKLTENPPFPWQVALYDRFVSTTQPWPESCDLPTGLGKTSVIAVWLIAVAHHPERVPRRLAYVVNRRTVVDQTTDDVKRYRDKLEQEELAELRKKLGGALAISTLRGQFADNREWSADPSRPAVVIGTVDMIGSRLLFSGYGAGFRTRPLYAGLLGQDTLLVHDEAHLEPAFQELIEKIRDEQKREPAPLGEQLRLKVMEMSATPRSKAEPLKLEDADLANPEVRKRVAAKKALHLVANKDAKKLAEEMADFIVERFGESGRAILIFARRVEDVEKIAKRLPKEQTRLLTGTLRGMERDRLVEHPIFKRFLPHAEPGEQTVYLVCTSAGEVGVNISADHLVCDLSTFDSMAQRLGRVNRFGLRDDTEVHVFHPVKLDKEDDLESRMSKSLDLLRHLDGDASPRAIRRTFGQLDREARLATFAPRPTILSTSDILLDAWALTSVKGDLPGRPKVEPYLHGMRDLEPPQTSVAWREEVGIITGRLRDAYPPEELLEDYPLKPQELLRDRSDRVIKHLAARAEQWPEEPVWLLDEEGSVEPVTLAELAEKDAKERIEHRTVILTPATGGVRSDGMLDGSAEEANDVADEVLSDDEGNPRRRRVWSDDEQFEERTRGMRLIRRIDIPVGEEDEDAEPQSWYWFERPAGGDTDGSKSAPQAIRWQHHTDDVVNNVREFTSSLPLSAELKDAIVLAGRVHDLGKKREHWQRSIGNPNPTDWHAKSDKGWRPRELTAYRHEFGSLLDLRDDPEFKSLASKPDVQDLVLHLVAAHHGYARPHFPQECAVDFPNHSTAIAAEMARQVPQRFARLQRKYGRWGLAYLESLLRAADYEASAHPTRTEGER